MVLFLYKLDGILYSFQYFCVNEKEVKSQVLRIDVNGLRKMIITDSLKNHHKVVCHKLFTMCDYFFANSSG